MLLLGKILYIEKKNSNTVSQYLYILDEYLLFEYLLFNIHFSLGTTGNIFYGKKGHH